MTKMLNFFFVFFTFFLLFACNENENEPVLVDTKFGETLTLKIGEMVEVNGEELTIVFDKIIADSRCPIGVDCVWEGQAEVNLLVNQTKEVLVIMRAGHEELAKDTLDNLVFTLLTVNPYPDLNTGLPIDTAAYSIDLQVDKL